MKKPKPASSKKPQALAKKITVLADHKKVGKKLVPPYVATLGQPEHISWIDIIIPEVIWIGLLHEKYGNAEGTALALHLAQLANKTVQKAGASFFAAASDYYKLSDSEKAAILRELAFSKKLTRIQRALFPLFHFYPTCPLSFLAAEENMAEPQEGLLCLKNVLSDLFDKELKRTVFVQATVVYFAFVLERLKVVEGLTLARFPEVEDYPNTEISRRVAAALRPTVLSFFRALKQETSTSWSTDFWNQGMRIEACIFK